MKSEETATNDPSETKNPRSKNSALEEVSVEQGTAKKNHKNSKKRLLKKIEEHRSHQMRKLFVLIGRTI